MATNITYAGYGVWNSTIDVTTQIRKAAIGGTTVFQASNTLIGDPSPGNRKYLYMVWNQGGKTMSGVVGEDDSKGIAVGSDATITYAGYGVWNSTADVGASVGSAYGNGTRTFVASNSWVAGDPSPGDRKYLYVVWNQNGTPYSGVVGEGDPKGVTVPSITTTPGTQVLYAGYGVWNNVVDVTSTLSQRLNAGQKQFQADNNIWGDPSPGDRKYLYAFWSNSNTIYSAVVGEGDSRGIVLP
jgi:hypothetical protein